MGRHDRLPFRRNNSARLMGPGVRRDDIELYFFPNTHAGSGGPNASSPEIFARIL